MTRSKMARAAVQAAIAATAVVAVSAVATSPVSAAPLAGNPVQTMASSLCLVGTSGNCTTAVIGADPSQHFVDYTVNNRYRSSPCPWRVRDVDTGVVVRSGAAPVFEKIGGSIFGLYGYYQLELRGCTISTIGYLDNDW